MSYLLNRATLRAFGGKEATRGLKQEAWNHLNRLLMARKLGRLCGLSGIFSIGRNRRFLERLEKNLRFLENCGAIRIHKGRIHYTDQKIDFGEEGQGKINIVQTMANALHQAGEEIWEGKKTVSLKDLTDCLSSHSWNLFYGPTNFRILPKKSDLYHKAKTKWFHPVLRLLASERAARRILVKLNERGSEEERQRLMREHPQTIENIRFVEQEVARVRGMPFEQVRETFSSPKQAAYVPHDFSLLGGRKKGERCLVPVISDTHVEPNPHPKKEDLLRFYQFVLNLDAPSVVHNGDYYELFAFAATLDRIRSANPLIMNALSHMPAILQISGNHDAALRRMFPEAIREQLGPNVHVPEDGTYREGRVYFEHGHQSDRHNREDQKTGYYVVKTASWLQQSLLFRLLLPNLNLIGWLEVVERLWFSAEEWKDYKVDALVERVEEVESRFPGTQENPRIYVRGHDHGGGYWFTVRDMIKAVSKKLMGKVRYYTTGSWKGDEAYFVVLDFSHPNRVFAYPFLWTTTYDQFAVFKDAA